MKPETGCLIDGAIPRTSEERCEGIQNRRSTNENHKYKVVERLKDTTMAKRRNKTYEQQNKLYNAYNNYESLDINQMLYNKPIYKEAI